MLKRHSYSRFSNLHSLLSPLSSLLFSLLLLASCAPANGPIPHILDVQSSASEVPCYDKFELVVALEATYDNPYDVRQVDLSAVFTGPDGREWSVPGFWDADDAWRVRYPAALHPRYCREARPLPHLPIYPFTHLLIHCRVDDGA